MKILIIDDDELIRTVMEKTLTAAGHDIDESVNGTDAIEMLKKHAYDVVVTDVVMPGQSGISVGEYIQEHSIPSSVLAVSAQSEMLDFANYFADDTLAKPFRKEELLNAVNNLSKGVNVESALQNM